MDGVAYLLEVGGLLCEFVLDKALRGAIPLSPLLCLLYGAVAGIVASECLPAPTLGLGLHVALVLALGTLGGVVGAWIGVLFGRAGLGAASGGALLSSFELVRWVLTG